VRRLCFPEDNRALAIRQAGVQQDRRTSELEESVKPYDRVDIHVGRESDPVSKLDALGSKGTESGADPGGYVGVGPNFVVGDQAIACRRFACGREHT
jgi:hypothetical protein